MLEKTKINEKEAGVGPFKKIYFMVTPVHTRNLIGQLYFKIQLWLSGETPLHTAAIRGSPRLVRQLLVMGADPNAQDHAEWSPLHEVNRATLF